MVGLFSRLSSSRHGHRSTRRALNDSEASASNIEDTTAVVTVTHGLEVAAEFKPLEHPIEPLDSDQPIQCPLPEPSILNDGRIWKERVSASARRQSDWSAMQDGPAADSEAPAVPKPNLPSKRMIAPSVSAPERNILKLLEDSGI